MTICNGSRPSVSVTDDPRSYAPPVSWLALVEQMREAPARHQTAELDVAARVVAPLFRGLLSGEETTGTAIAMLAELAGVNEELHRTRTYDERLSTAYHESGHAVVGSVLGLGIKSVSIETGGSGETAKSRLEERGLIRAGCAEFHDVSHREAWFTTQLAGPLAQQIAGYPANSSEDHDARVYRQILEARTPTTDEEALALVGYYRARARSLVVRWWPSIRGLALRLMEEPEITGERAEALIENALSEQAQKESAA